MAPVAVSSRAHEDGVGQVEVRDFGEVAVGAWVPHGLTTLGAREVGMSTVWMNSQGEQWPGGTRADHEIDNLLHLPEAIAAIAYGQ